MATLSIDPAYLVNQAHFDQLYTHLLVNFGHDDENDDDGGDNGHTVQ